MYKFIMPFFQSAGLRFWGARLFPRTCDTFARGLCEEGLKSGGYLFQGLALYLFTQGDKAAFAKRPSAQERMVADETLVLINILWAYRLFFFLSSCS